MTIYNFEIKYARHMKFMSKYKVLGTIFHKLAKHAWK